MYGLISSLNGVLREFVISNPFEYIFENQITAILVFSFLGNTIIHRTSFDMCGIFYKKGKNKTMGSIGYMICYCINIAILTKLC